MIFLNLFPYFPQDVGIQNDIPWNIQQVNASSFWQKTKGDGVVVAVVDSGICLNHSEFTGRIINPKDFTYDNNIVDQDGHGSHVAGIIGGFTVGIAPECRIMPLKVFGKNSANGFQFQDAMKYILDYNKSVEEKDRVVAVNCSFGSSVCDTILCYLIRQLVDSGVTFVVSAGNSGDGKADTSEIFNYPGYIWEVITVGALNQDATVAVYSSSYDGIDISSFGTSIYSAWCDGGYKTISGTSMSAPHVTGAVALIYAAFKQREGRYPTTDEVENILFKHVRKVSIEEEFVGHGLLDLTWDNRKWPLYRCQVGAYYNKSGADSLLQKVKDAGFSTYMVKY